MPLSNSSLRIFLARHGQSELNLAQRISGQSNARLSEKGLQQAAALSDVLRHEPLTAIYASSLERAKQTARPTAVAHGINITEMDELSEIRLGILEGRYVDDRDPPARDLWALRSQDKRGFTVSGGEKYPAFEQRVLRGLHDILANSMGSILIVAHRNTNEILLGQLLKNSLVSQADINIKNKYLYAINYAASPAITTIRLGGEHHGRHYPGLRT